MRKTIIIFMALIFLSGCSFWNVKRHIIMPDGETIYTIDARKDDLVKFQDDSFVDAKGIAQKRVKIEIDGRGRPGMIEQALGIMFMNLPDVEIAK